MTIESSRRGWKYEKEDFDTIITIYHPDYLCDYIYDADDLFD
jgi:hypothetical protein